MTNLVTDRLRVNKLVLKIASWVASAVARRVELWDDTLVIPPALAARAAVFAFGDELVDLRLPNYPDPQRLSPGGRDMAAAYLLPRAEAALRQPRRCCSTAGCSEERRVRVARGETGPPAQSRARATYPKCVSVALLLSASESAAAPSSPIWL